MSAGLDNLKNIVVLMMENRSFDHMLGFAKSANWPIEGLSGNETNQDSAGGVAQVSNDADYAGDFTPDPGHSVFDTLTQLYGDPTTPVTQNPAMSGFVRSYEEKQLAPNDAHRIMKCFSGQKVPVLTSLAQQFCVCDHWFASVPGPTFPNRAFVHGATSIGRVDMGLDWRKMSTTIYERLAQNNVDACIYYHDTTMAMTFNGLAGSSDYFGLFDDFLWGCKNNKLPPYSFIEPRFANAPPGGGKPAYSASDQHPDHDVNEGEALIQTVFNAIWGNQKVRESTLLVIVYDEHGGLYDHVPPPATINPDNLTFGGGGDPPDPKFDFTRLGVRVPAVLISPYIEAGRIDQRVYDHTSVIATARKLLIPNVANSHLTLRDKNANTFEDNLTLPAPRTDAINMNAAKSAPPTAAQLAQPPSGHLQTLVQQASMLEKQYLPPEQQSGKDPNTIQTEAEASLHLQSVMGKIRAQQAGQAGAAGGRTDRGRKMRSEKRLYHPTSLCFVVATALFVLCASGAWGQDPPSYNGRVADTSDWGKWKANCSNKDEQPFTKAVMACATSAFTSRPFHFLAQSIVPGSGVGGGGRYARDVNSGRWQNQLIATSVVSIRQFWFAELQFTGERSIRADWNKSGESLGLNVYARNRSLPSMPFYGLGPNTNVNNSVRFSQRDTSAGIEVTSPFPEVSWLSIGGKLEGLWPSVGGISAHNVISIQQQYNEQTAPGLTTQPPMVHEQILLLPLGRPFEQLGIDYNIGYHFYQDTSTGHFSFRRFEADLQHHFYPTRDKRRRARLDSEFLFRWRYSVSDASARNAVPFYLQETLGGSDIESQPTLRAFRDYRFRGPDLMMVQVEYDRRLCKECKPCGQGVLRTVCLHLGLLAAYDAGKVALRKSDLDFSGMHQSFGGGFAIYLADRVVFRVAVALGGGEGVHPYFGIADFLH